MDNALVKRMDKWMKTLFIATDEYLSHGDMPMEQPTSMPTVKPKRKYTKKKKSMEPVIPIVQKPVTPIVQKPVTPMLTLTPKIELVTSPKKIPDSNIAKMMDDIDMEITLLNALGEKYPNIEWPHGSSFVQLVFTSVVDKYDHPFIYDIPYHGIFENDIVQDTNGISLALYPGVHEDYPESFPIDHDNLGKQLTKLQDNDIICIPVYFTIIEDDKGVTEQHMNLLIYRPKEHMVDHFEPHGSSYYSKYEYYNEFNAYIDKGMKMLWENQLTKYIGKVRYMARDITCPVRVGIQVLSGGEYCALITIFMAEMCLKNPKVSTTEIINKVMEISKKDPAYIKRILNGYIVTAFKHVKTYTKDVYMHLSKNEQHGYDILKRQIIDTPR